MLTQEAIKLDAEVIHRTRTWAAELLARANCLSLVIAFRMENGNVEKALDFHYVRGAPKRIKMVENDIPEQTKGVSRNSPHAQTNSHSGIQKNVEEKQESSMDESNLQQGHDPSSTVL
ncbi:hypothetical protein GUJ93_ZPchr0012g19107 [Zizania palustris]|uniref:Uncharacterized protein n=1 Tax=Zizania palustris TaxID=103762 RepID=A0A8J5WMC7_ZIZPA|nr:hypothetical protein GUJ93_ZPchr0012g19107 [Zizania palustris]